MGENWTPTTWLPTPPSLFAQHHSTLPNHHSQLSPVSQEPLNKTFSDESNDTRPLALNIFIIVGCSLIIIGTLFGNILVCLAVAITRKLRTPSNSLIVSLAFSDLLIAIIVMPFALIYEVTKEWIFGQVACDIWTSLDVFFCTSSILNLCAISIDRYFVITRPFTYALMRTPLRMTGMIVCVWLASAIVSIPPQFGWRKKITEGQCVISEELGYQLFATVGAFYLPLAVMVTIYTKIYLVSSRLSKTTSYNRTIRTETSQRRHSSLVSTAGTLTGAGHPLANCPGTQTDTRDRRQSSPYFEPAFEGDSKLGKRRKSSSVLFFDRLTKRPPPSSCSSQQHPASEGRKKNLDSHYDVQISGHSNLGLSEGSLSSNKRKDRSRSMSQMFSKINHKLKLTSIKPPKVNTERKATMTLGVIMGTFIACWLPFFILALVKPFLGDLSKMIPRWLDVVFLWLGYANSFLNPIIYARFNRDFRVPFRLILQCRCRSINSHVRVSEFAEQYGKNHPPPSRHISNDNEKQVRRITKIENKLSNSNNNKRFMNKSQHALDDEEGRSFLHDNKEEDSKPLDGCHNNDNNSNITKPQKYIFPTSSTHLSAEGVSNEQLTNCLETRKRLTEITTSPSAPPTTSSTLLSSFCDIHSQPLTKSGSLAVIGNQYSACIPSIKPLSYELLATGFQGISCNENANNPNENCYTNSTIKCNNNTNNKCYSNIKCKNNTNNKCFTPTTTSKLRTTHKEFRKPTLVHQHKLFSPKHCHAPVINMSMLVDDDDDEEDDEEDYDFKKIEEKNESKIIDERVLTEVKRVETHEDERLHRSANKPQACLLLQKERGKPSVGCRVGYRCGRNEYENDENVEILRKKKKQDEINRDKLTYCRSGMTGKMYDQNQCENSEKKGCGKGDGEVGRSESGLELTGKRQSPVSVEKFPKERDDNSVLKVFNTSFNKINQEDSFMF